MDLRRILLERCVLISGSTGLIGKQLCAFFACMGHGSQVGEVVTKLPADANKEK